MGLGGKLVDECVAFAKEKGYRGIVLWTQSCLHDARRLYKRAGFELKGVDAEREAYGKKLVSETWELVLSDRMNQTLHEGRNGSI
jgi:predicted N-acetyltransferase YhbS